MKQNRMVVGLDDPAMIHQQGTVRSRRSEVLQLAIASSGANFTGAASIGALGKVVGPDDNHNALISLSFFVDTYRGTFPYHSVWFRGRQEPHLARGAGLLNQIDGCVRGA